uniref:Amidase domain-containing protein n=1 Tax=Heligmosomoides polygyrus TaxID=6339 RepID=A0A183FFF6_HELPZ
LRFSHRGVCGSVPGRPLINSNDGPMTLDIKTTVVFLKERAVLEAKAQLEAAGHTLVPFHPPSIPVVMRYFVRAVCVDGGSFLLRKLFNDIVDPILYSQVVLFMIPLWLQRALAYPAKNDKIHLSLIEVLIAELRETYADIEDYRGDFVVMMKEQKLDALLCPPQVMTAPKHNVPARLFAACSYTALFNLLDFGAGVVKVTEVTAEDDRKLEEEYPSTDPWYRLVKESCKGCVGYPVAVQVAAPPYKEETVLRILRDIEIAVRGN